MSSNIQLISFAFSFFYGMFFCLTSKVNESLINNKKVLVKLLVTLVFIIDIVILYIYLMYKINNGIFHIYFILSLIIGYVILYLNFNKLLFWCKKCVNDLKKRVK